MSNSTGVVIFLAGGVVGALTTWFVTNKKLEEKYEKICDEEVKSVKEAYSKQKGVFVRYPEHAAKNEREAADQAKEKPDILEYTSVIRGSGYSESTSRKESSRKNARPYVITPDEFGEKDDYQALDLIFFVGDGVLTDDNHEIVEDVDGTIGKASLHRFGEYEDDSLFVRNDRLKCDFDILLDQRSYKDVIPHPPKEV